MKTIMLNLDGHSVFSPSASEMWLNCSGSLIANMQARQEGDNKGSQAAADGTVAHEMAEIWLKTGRKPIEYIGEIRKVGEFDVEVTEEMLAYVADYVNWCNEQDGDKFVEVKVDFSHLTPVPNQKGTSDHVCCADKKLTITDLKYGMGVKVEAENNTQLQIYALGVLHDYGFLYDFETVEMRICQPRLNHFSTWEISIEQLLKFGEYVKERAIAAWQPDAPRTPSEKGCLWCKVKAQCPAKAREMEAMIDEVFADDTDADTIERIEKDQYLVEFPEVEQLSIEHLEKIFNKSKQVKSFLDEIEKKLFYFALKGGKLHEYKLVAGRNTRKWKDEEQICGFLRENGFNEDDYAPRSTITPAQAEKLCKKSAIAINKLEPFIANRLGKPTLAPITDKRPAFEEYADVDWGE